MKTHRPAVVMVLGMHRSGTSLVASMLQGIGLRLSGDLLEANEFNARGYFESRAVMELHDRILGVLGSAWNRPTTTAPFPDRWWESAPIVPLREALVRLVHRETDGGETPWAVKDPRASRLLPLWNAVFEDLGIDAACVLSVRDPAQVAASLARRDGTARPSSDLLWLEHNAAALDDGAERIKAVVPYAAWFEDGPATLKSLQKALGLPAVRNAAAQRTIAEGVVADLRHHTDDEPSPLPYVDDLYRALATGSREAAAEALAPLAAARALAAAAAHAVAAGEPAATLIHEVGRRLSWRVDVTDAEVAPFVDSDDPAARRTSRLARSRTSIRRALRDAVSAAETDGFADPITMNAVQSLVPISDDDTPYLAVLRHRADAALAAGQPGRAVDIADELFRRAYASGIRPGERAAEAFAYLSDEATARLCEELANALSPSPPEDVADAAAAVVIIFTPGDAATRDRVTERARRFASEGLEVTIVATEPCADADVWSPDPGPAAARLQAVLERLAAAPNATRCFMPLARDAVARIAASARHSADSYWENGLVAGPGLEPDDGYAVLTELVDAAQPYDRAASGIPAEAIVLATVGRLEKCADPLYLHAMDRILRIEPDAWLTISGADAAGLRSLVTGSFEPLTRARVVVLPPDHWREVVVGCDVYCDTMPRHGTKGILAAARIGRPIVSLTSPLVPCAADDLEYGARASAEIARIRMERAS